MMMIVGNRFWFDEIIEDWEDVLWLMLAGGETRKDEGEAGLYICSPIIQLTTFTAQQTRDFTLEGQTTK
jgi:hypothetical protein